MDDKVTIEVGDVVAWRRTDKWYQVDTVTCDDFRDLLMRESIEIHIITKKNKDSRQAQEDPKADDLDALVDEICEPGSSLWDGENSDLDGKYFTYPSPDGIKKAIEAWAKADRAAQRQAGREEMREELRQDYEDWRNKIEGQLAERYSAVVGALKNVSEAEQSVAYQKTGFSEQLAILSMLRHCGEIARKALSDLGAQVKL